MERRYRFKLKKSIPLSYDRQGYVYFACRNYSQLPVQMRRQIDRLIETVGGVYADALRAFMIQGESASAVEARYHCSYAQVYRVVKEFYMRFP